MKTLFSLIRNNKIWSGISGLLIVIGGAAYTPVVSIGQSATQQGVEAYCDAEPDAEACADKED